MLLEWFIVNQICLAFRGGVGVHAKQDRERKQGKRLNKRKERDRLFPLFFIPVPILYVDLGLISWVSIKRPK